MYSTFLAVKMGKHLFFSHIHIHFEGVHASPHCLRFKTEHSGEEIYICGSLLLVFIVSFVSKLILIAKLKPSYIDVCRTETPCFVQVV